LTQIRPIHAAPGAALLLLLVAPGPAGAVAETECRTTAVTELPGEPKDPDLAQGPSGCSSQMSNSVAFVTSTAGADFGALFARAEGTYLEGETDRAETDARASFEDTITVTSPGREGQTAQVVASTRLTGFVDLTGSGKGSFAINVGVGPQVVAGESQSCFADSPTGCDGRPYPAFFEEVIPVVFEVQLGVPTSLRMILVAGADRSALLTSPGTSDVNFGSTAYWGGIEEVTASGEPIAFAVASESGTDYAVPAPEPGRAALVLAGALGLAGAGRRGRDRRRS
jgi:hypothetical protein